MGEPASHCDVMLVTTREEIDTTFSVVHDKHTLGKFVNVTKFC
jgi:hypothetical protein